MSTSVAAGIADVDVVRLAVASWLLKSMRERRCRPSTVSSGVSKAVGARGRDVEDRGVRGRATPAAPAPPPVPVQQSGTGVARGVGLELRVAPALERLDGAVRVEDRLVQLRVALRDTPACSARG